MYIHEIIAMEFDWHDAKRESNLVKHGIDFVDITECLEQGDGLFWEDTRHDYGETRVNLMAEWHGRLVHITFTMRGTFAGSFRRGLRD
jgi:uncharacterized DUF497 family protein